MKIRLFCLLSNFSFGGAGNSVFRLIHNLNQEDYKIYVISIGKCPYKFLNKNNNIFFFELKKSGILNSFFKIYNILKTYKSRDSKNIFLSNIHYNNVISIFLTKLFKNIKVVVVERTPAEELNIYYNLKDFFKKKIVKFLIFLLYRFSDKIIANSYGIKKSLMQISNAKVDVVYPPSVFKIRRFYKKKKNIKLKIIVISRLSIEKGIEDLIYAVNLLKKKKIIVNIYGEGNQLSHLKGLISTFGLNKIVFLRGYKNNLNNELINSDLFISTSHFEGCGNAIIESINLNTPVIVSDCPGGNREILLNGRGGVFYKSKNFYHLKKKISLFLINRSLFTKKNKLAKKSLDRFLLKTNICKYDNIFKEI
jgi:glycosyltransferase involved in cell wall biosynthesis